ncbi:MAG: hypothetical protein ACTSP4_09815 [Candidatus Hodarchaeales archaeon]
MTGVFFFFAFLIALRLDYTENPENASNANDNLTPVSIIIRNNLPVYTSVFLRHSAAYAIWTVPILLDKLGHSSRKG